MSHVFGRNWLRLLSTSNVLRRETAIFVPLFPTNVTDGGVMWVKKVGDRVYDKEVVCYIETDKSVIEVPSPGDGIILSRYVDEGQIVRPEERIFRMKVWPRRRKKSEQQYQDERISEPDPIQISHSSTELKYESSIDAPSSEKSLQKQSKEPFFESLENNETTPKKIRNKFKVKMTDIRKRIALRIKKTQNEAALLTTFNEIDMSNAIAFRSAHQEAFKKKYSINIGYMSTFLKAAAYALEDQPIVNAYMMGDEIIYRDYIDISIAVASPNGLAIVVIRNVSLMNLAQIEKKIVDFTEKAGKGALAVGDIDGGTFSISNGGVFGSLMGTSIINPFQSAILGIHETVERPLAIKGQVVIRPMMYVALTYDHRLIDGREAVLFLQKIKKSVENPLIMIAGM